MLPMILWSEYQKCTKSKLNKSKLFKAHVLYTYEVGAKCMVRCVGLNVRVPDMLYMLLLYIIKSKVCLAVCLQVCIK